MFSRIATLRTPLPGRVLGDIAGPVEVTEEAFEARAEDVDRRRPFPATVGPCARHRRRQERGYGFVPEVFYVATVANVGRPAGKEAHVAAVLGDGVWGAPVGLQLKEEFPEAVFDAHGSQLGFLVLE